ncbi:MAG: hypothetical protein WAW92_01550 [Minisyncoccia bacterium]
METLARIFGSETKVKMMKLFLFNIERVYTTKDIADRTKSDISKVRRELSVLDKMGLIRKRQIKGRQGYVLNQLFPYLKQLQGFLIDVEPLQPREMVRKIGKSGSVKLIVTAGIFIQDSESRADLLVVGDGVKKAKLDSVIKAVEAEVGKELRYAFFSTEEFKYRMSMYDKLVRDILDYPHRILLDKLGILDEGAV